MNIYLHDSEMETIKKKTFPNLALMKISAYHKSIGDNVQWWNGETDGQLYSSKVFDFTKENKNLPANTIKGGTGYGLYGELPKEIDNCFPDYSIYPDCDNAIGFLTRGCINNCNFCIVPKKEGKIKSYAKWQDVVRNDINKIKLMDNNILSCQYGISQLEELSKTDYHIDINQGMDIMLLNDDICKILKQIKWIDYIRFSCDKDYQVPYFENMLELFKKHKLPKSKVFIYVLIQKDIESANRRIQTLHGMCKSFNLFAQAERNGLLGITPNKAQLEFAQRYVYGRAYKKETWSEYCKNRKFEF